MVALVIGLGFVVLAMVAGGIAAVAGFGIGSLLTPALALVVGSEPTGEGWRRQAVLRWAARPYFGQFRGSTLENGVVRGSTVQSVGGPGG